MLPQPALPALATGRHPAGGRHRHARGAPTIKRAQEEFADILAAWLEEEHAPEEIPPEWTPWQTPTLKKTVIQANANVALLQPSQDTSFAYWLRVSTLETAAADLPARARWRPIISAVWRASG